ncbi:MAG: acyl-CoA thioesterase [Euzebya sp.]
MSQPASISVARRIEWIDTDAAGIYHWLTAFRLVEAAEAALHQALGIHERTFGHIPRVHAEADFHAALRFYDEVRVDLAVADLGRTSVTYTFQVLHQDTVAVSGHVVGVFVGSRFEDGVVEWPPDIRDIFLTGGAVSVTGPSEPT